MKEKSKSTKFYFCRHNFDDDNNNNNIMSTICLKLGTKQPPLILIDLCYSQQQQKTRIVYAIYGTAQM
ncbi:hypothetical protein DERF_002005 [Dermatophagoides farinae]|uniref:Uncharacterized protein n=1 Tax=Dermatophagoides farinae TaxID=6954 RepID=A0A922IAM7_DERFA|nr:hypothetical protein DERF_002005 [Dermatophagoides farinae]